MFNKLDRNELVELRREIRSLGAEAELDKENLREIRRALYAALNSIDKKMDILLKHLGLQLVTYAEHVRVQPLHKQQSIASKAQTNKGKK